MNIRTLTAVAVIVLSACGTQVTPSVNADLRTGYETIEAYVTIVRRALQSDRITVRQAESASAGAKAVKATLDRAALALANCNTQYAITKACGDYTALMREVQPALLAFEQELRAQGE